MDLGLPVEPEELTTTKDLLSIQSKINDLFEHQNHYPLLLN